MMKFIKKYGAVFFLSSIVPVCFASDNARTLVNTALSQGTVVEAVYYLNDVDLNSLQSSDKRSLLYYKGMLEEQLGFYNEARSSYAQAAGIGAIDAKDMPKVTSEQLVLNAIRCSLFSGDYETADSYLNSAVRSSSDSTVIAYVNLYSVWSSLCRANSIPETKDALALLQAYSQMQSMEIVKPAVLLTLWYLTDEKKYSDQLKKEFPKSPECGVVTGKVQIMCAPFWYFVPRQPHNTIETPTVEPSSASVAASRAVTEQKVLDKPKAAKRQQLGLFRSEDNAKDLIKRLSNKGFDAYMYAEKRASGTTYYIVCVDENSAGTMGLKLKDAGFECYSVTD